jgi:hypothetical protein
MLKMLGRFFSVEIEASVLRLAESVFILAFIEGYEASIFTTGTRQQTH